MTVKRYGTVIRVGSILSPLNPPEFIALRSLIMPHDNDANSVRHNAVKEMVGKSLKICSSPSALCGMISLRRDSCRLYFCR